MLQMIFPKLSPLNSCMSIDSVHLPPNGRLAFLDDAVLLLATDAALTTKGDDADAGITSDCTL